MGFFLEYVIVLEREVVLSNMQVLSSIDIQVIPCLLYVGHRFYQAEIEPDASFFPRVTQ